MRKLGVPGQAELDMDAIVSKIEVLNENIMQHLRLSREMIDWVKVEEEVLQERHNQLTKFLRRYRGNKPPLKIEG